MTSTPRTTAKYAEIFAEDDHEAIEKMNAFAQELERELNEAKERIERLRKAGNTLAVYAPSNEVRRWKEAANPKTQ